MDLNYAAMRPYGWSAFALWVIEILVSEVPQIPDALGTAIFVSGFVVLGIGIFRSANSGG